ncbi:hypothetical protein [Trinickia mobilis]|uniref:hypothetical protein n=1 Tax=Trinickia mobilis TaxID=2816356 RepID=UPI001A8C805E|nr:hypothetical protein [Trinickia mobilis]
MDETLVGMAIGISVLVLASIFIAGHYRRERLRSRIVDSLHGHRLYDFTRSKR